MTSCSILILPAVGSALLTEGLCGPCAPPYCTWIGRCILLSFETESDSIVEAGLQLTPWSRLTLNSWQSTCLSLQSARIAGMSLRTSNAAGRSALYSEPTFAFDNSFVETAL